MRQASADPVCLSLGYNSRISQKEQGALRLNSVKIHVTAKLSLLRICVCVKKESARLRRLLIAIGDLP
uniref:Uncharacterized protein n=1 Tax=Knipowitschia caucasica TaxID=637954 RepID=A0AAV2IY41_KNICA